MKAVFPCNGSVVLSKNDIESLRAFYNAKLIASKVYDLYNNSNYMIQVGNFNYIPKEFTITLNDVTLLDIIKLRDLLGLSTPKTINQNSNRGTEVTSPISDDTLLSHPFFQTLNPIN